MKRELQLPGVGQIGVVEDLDRAIAFYESTFGLGPFDIREVGAPNDWDRGQEKQIKARLGFATIGSVELELIQILEGDSFHLEFLREHGEGLHPTAIRLPVGRELAFLVHEPQNSALRFGRFRPSILEGVWGGWGGWSGTALRRIHLERSWCTW